MYILPYVRFLFVFSPRPYLSQSQPRDQIDSISPCLMCTGHVGTWDLKSRGTSLYPGVMIQTGYPGISFTTLVKVNPVTSHGYVGGTDKTVTLFFRPAHEIITAIFCRLGSSWTEGVTNTPFGRRTVRVKFVHYVILVLYIQTTQFGH